MQYYITNIFINNHLNKQTCFCFSIFLKTVIIRDLIYLYNYETEKHLNCRQFSCLELDHTRPPHSLIKKFVSKYVKYMYLFVIQIVVSILYKIPTK